MSLFLLCTWGVGHSKTILLLAFLEHFFMLKSWGWGVAHVIVVSAPVQRIGVLGIRILVLLGQGIGDLDLKIHDLGRT